MSGDSLRVAIVGAGHIGGIHAKSLYAIGRLSPGNARLEYIVDVDFDRAKRLARIYGATPLRWDDVDRLRGVDLAIVATPTDTHRLVVEKLLDKGVEAMLVEKPLASTLEDAAAIVSYSRRAWIAAGHSERFNPALQGVRVAASHGLLAEVDAVETRRLGPFVERAKNTDVIHDLAIHDFDIILTLVGGMPHKVFSIARRGLVSDTIDYSTILLRFNSTISSTVVGRISPIKERIVRIYTKLGSIIELDFLNFRARSIDEVEIEIPLKVSPPIYREDLEVVTRLREGRDPPVGVQEAFLTLYLCKTAMTSAELGVSIEIRETPNYAKYREILLEGEARYEQAHRLLMGG